MIAPDKITEKYIARMAEIGPKADGTFGCLVYFVALPILLWLVL